ILNHPLTRDSPLRAFGRIISWQIKSRISRGPITVSFVNQSKSLVHRGMHGATGNIYVGLHEFEQMDFLLHFLRSEDTFIDVGANVGSYTVLASAVVGAKTIAFEPMESEYKGLMANIELNGIAHLVDARNIAVGARQGSVTFTK